jgi:succinate dehydrogenase/fumarate reductase flavoprotein subunit
MMFEKTAAGLRQALAELAAVREEMVPSLRLRTTSARYNTELVDALDVRDMLDVCEMAAHASLAREESRGPHYRKDFPMTDNRNWLKQVVVSREGGRVKSRLLPVRQKYVRPRREKIDYLADPYA